MFWLEVLSVQGAVKNATGALRVITDWLEVCETLRPVICPNFSDRPRSYSHLRLFSVCNHTLQDLAHIFAIPCSSRTQHQSFRKLYKPYVQPLTRVVQGIPVSWELNTPTTGCSFTVELATWSPCNRFHAVHSGDTTVTP